MSASSAPPLIIDAHVHIGTGDGLRGPWDTAGSLPLYLSRARPAGIRGAVIMPPLTSDYPRANAEIARIIASRPGFLGFLFVNTRTEVGRIAERVAVAVRQGFCGIKVHAHDARITREVAEAARRWRLPVLYDPAGDTATVEMVVRAYPDVAWIVPHLSSFADDWKAQCAFVDQLVRLPNLFTDTSGVRYYDLLDDAVRRAGPHKVLFGSDGPFLHPAVELAKAKALPLDRAGRADVLAGNVLRLTSASRPRFRARRPPRRLGAA
jgi:predicted TIM-barrel fold metal-dependent hydrolase